MVDKILWNVKKISQTRREWLDVKLKMKGVQGENIKDIENMIWY